MNDEKPRITAIGTEPEPDVIAALEEMLAMARTGELRGFAHVALLTNKGVKWGFFGREIKGGYMRTCGLLQWLAHQAMLKWDDESVEQQK